MEVGNKGSQLNSVYFSGILQNQAKRKDVKSQFYGANNSDKFTGNTTSPIGSTLNLYSLPEISKKNKLSDEQILNKYATYEVIDNALKTNPKITELIKSKGIEPNIYMENITNQSSQHFYNTCSATEKILSENPELFRHVNKENLKTASLLHDIGKVFIPPSILNKPAKLNEQERDVVSIHAQLGEEILKTTDLPKEVATLVGLHHKPKYNILTSKNISAQALSAADVYSALAEKRPYKEPLPKEKISEIMFVNPALNQLFSHQLVT